MQIRHAERSRKIFSVSRNTRGNFPGKTYLVPSILALILFLGPQQLHAGTFGPLTNFPAGMRSFWNQNTPYISDYPNRIFDLSEASPLMDSASRSFYSIEGESDYVLSAEHVSNIPMANWPYDDGDYLFYMFLGKNSDTLENEITQLNNTPYDTLNLGFLGSCQNASNSISTLEERRSFAISNSAYSYMHIIPCELDGLDVHESTDYIHTSVNLTLPGGDAGLYGYVHTDEDLSYIDTEAEFNDLYRNLVFSGEIATSTTWFSDYNYIVSGNLTVNPGVTLTIEPGTVVKFNTATTSKLTIDGTLSANGYRIEATTTPSWQPVSFTSIEDDNIGNPYDANANGTSTPAAGDWGGITINSGGSANLTGAIIRYAGHGTGAGIYNNGGNVRIASSTIALNGTYGIYNDSGTTTASWIDLGFQDYGLYVENGSASIVASSTIHDNHLFGVYNDTLNTINAERNYWATSTGPSALHGSAVFGAVDYTPHVESLEYVQIGCPSSSCGSVQDNQLLYMASTTYVSELDSAIDVWDSEGKISIVASTTPNLLIGDTHQSDIAWKGGWTEVNGFPDVLQLNRYYLDSDSYNERQQTILHELGHALGLTHSFTGNVMFHNQSAQITLGPQDLADYHYLWP